MLCNVGLYYVTFCINVALRQCLVSCSNIQCNVVLYYSVKDKTPPSEHIDKKLTMLEGLLTPVGGEVPMVGRLCEAKLLEDEWRLDLGEEEENPNA